MGDENAVAVVAVTDQVTLVGSSAPDWETELSRPSKTNCTESSSEAQNGDSGREWWRKKNNIVNRFIEERPDRAARPISVIEGTKIREDCARETHRDDGLCRSKPWSEVLNEFLMWYNGYRNSYLVFNDPNGERVKSEMQNSHMPEYGDRYYARLKAFERQIIKEYDQPYSVLLTLSGSSENANGGWRCPADHMREVVDSFRPDSGRGVYHALRSQLDGREWEYAVVVEKHESGYAHVHLAVFVDGEVSESDFHPVIDRHLQKCTIAGADAHNYYSEDPVERPISVNEIDPSIDMTELSEKERVEVDKITNLGSYIGEYIGSHGKPLFERSISELSFRAAAWATGTQLVRFSTGANEMIHRDREQRQDGEFDVGAVRMRVEKNEEFNFGSPAESPDGEYPFMVENKGWEIMGVERIVHGEKEVFKIRESGVSYVELQDSSVLDPPKYVAYERPHKETSEQNLTDI